MTNFEKHGDRSAKIWSNTLVAKEHATPTGAAWEFWDWLTSPAVPILTPEERKIAEALQVLGFPYMARDMGTNFLYAYKNKPQKTSTCWSVAGYFFIIDASLFPSIQWTDEEPTKISDLLEVES